MGVESLSVNGHKAEGKESSSLFSPGLWEIHIYYSRQCVISYEVCSFNAVSMQFCISSLKQHFCTTGKLQLTLCM